MELQPSPPPPHPLPPSLSAKTIYIRQLHFPSSNFTKDDLDLIFDSQRKANFLPFLLTFILAFSTNTKASSLVAKDQVPCTMYAECENPCQPLPPPPPQVIECPPPPSLPPPPPPSPPPPLPPAIVECPPPHAFFFVNSCFAF
ncbi:unnamed protein product [Trifolium pratense]|uniref:Uncharacterized protein n=1 Tax=Trifolium pratense TaxID=57577 RepID=A0ACB0KA99_TRIPR|nr:unnamed protein product [Trifolium pratense]